MNVPAAPFTLRYDLPCRQCRQSLRGQLLGGVCPGCGGKVADSYAATLPGRAPTNWLRSVRLGGFIVLIGCAITPCAWPVASMLMAEGGTIRQTTFHTQSSGNYNFPASSPVSEPHVIPSMPPARAPKAPTFPAELPPDSPSSPTASAPVREAESASVPPAPPAPTNPAATPKAQTQPDSSPDYARAQEIMSRAFPDPHPITPIGLTPSTAPSAPGTTAAPSESASEATPAATTTTIRLGNPIPGAIFITLWTLLLAAGVFLATRTLPDDTAPARLQCWLARLASVSPLLAAVSMLAPDSTALQWLQPLALMIFLCGWPLYWHRVAHLLSEIPLPIAARRLRLATLMLWIMAGIGCLFVTLPPLLGSLATILWLLVGVSALLAIPALIAFVYALLKQFELCSTLSSALAARNAL